MRVRMTSIGTRAVRVASFSCTLEHENEATRTAQTPDATHSASLFLAKVLKLTSLS